MLHPKEIIEFDQLQDFKQASFLASRWAYKEALVKALNEKNLHFHMVYLRKLPSGKPELCIDKHHLEGNPS